MNLVCSIIDFQFGKYFLTQRKKIILVPLQKLEPLLDYKMILKVDCAYTIVLSEVYLKACYLIIIQIKIYLHLPILLNNHSQSIPYFWDLFRLHNSSESKYYKRIKEMYNLQCISAIKLCTRCL